MPDGGEENIKPLNPKIGEEVGHIVKAKGFDEEPKPKKPQAVNKEEDKTEPAPLNLKAEGEIGHIVSATGFDELTEKEKQTLGGKVRKTIEGAVKDKDEEYLLKDIGNEPLPTAEREKIRSLYKELIKVLPSIGFEESEIKGSGRWEGKKFHFIGVPGEFAIAIRRKGQVHLERRLRDKKGETLSTDEYSLSDTGTLAYFKDGGIHDRSEAGIGEWRVLPNGYVSENAEKNGIETINNAGQLITQIVESVNNPEHSIESIREKIKEIRSSLIGYFEKEGIKPEFLTVDFYHKTPGALANFFEQFGHEDENKEGVTYRIQVPKYEGYAYSSKKGVHVKFDTDQEDDLARVEKYRNKQSKAHGIGVLIRRHGTSQDNSSPLSYNLWENGDASVPNNAMITEYLDNFGPYINDPHQVLIECLKLESAIIGKPLPPELRAKESPLQKLINLVNR